MLMRELSAEREPRGSEPAQKSWISVVRWRTSRAEPHLGYTNVVVLVVKCEKVSILVDNLSRA